MILWLTVAIRLIVPVSIESPISVFNLLPTTATTSSAVTTSAAVTTSTAQTQKSKPVNVENVALPDNTDVKTSNATNRELTITDRQLYRQSAINLPNLSKSLSKLRVLAKLTMLNCLEGLNNKIKVAKKVGYGYRDDNYFFTLVRYISLPANFIVIPQKM